MPFKDQHPLYHVWKSMRSRCRNPRFRQWADYGGRGIKICERWSLFANFLADMRERPEGHLLDRIDNDGDYSPDNCRWVTPKDSQANRRITIRYEIEGRSYLLVDLARMSGHKPDTIKDRIASGMTKLSEIIAREKFVFREGLVAGAKASSISRKSRTHCKRGHPFDEANTGRQKGGRYCKACDALRGRGLKGML